LANWLLTPIQAGEHIHDVELVIRVRTVAGHEDCFLNFSQLIGGVIIRGAMKKETVDQLIQFLTLMAHHSREYALKLKAFEQVAKKHPEIFRAYEEYLEELHASALAEESHEHTEEALEALRAELLRDHD
jgi:hypothetical protein